MKKLHPIFMITLLLVVNSCNSKKESDLYNNFEEARLVGMVYDLDNRAVANLSITFGNPEDKKDKPLTITTDVNGRFALTLKRGSHRFITEHTDYLVVEDRIDFSSRGQILYIKVKSVNQLLNLAAQAIQKEQWREAKALLDEVATADAENVLYGFYLATYYYAQKEYPMAIEILEALSLRSRDPSIKEFLHLVYQKNAER